MWKQMWRWQYTSLSILIIIGIFAIWIMQNNLSPSNNYINPKPKPKIRIIQANVDFEKKLCSSKIEHPKTDMQREYERCPKKGIVTVVQGGRLGNQVWEYASVWAFARQNGLEPYVPRCIRNELEQIYESLSVRALDEIAHCPINLNSFVHSLNKWHNTNQSIILNGGSVLLVETVLIYIQDLPKEFTIRKDLREKADNILRLANKEQHTFPVYIGIHVRRSDYTEYLKPHYGMNFVDSKYFYKAMDYFEEKYQSVVFVVVSDDPDWCSENLTKNTSVYIVGKNTSAPQDWAIMAACNHTIIDYGSYGVWGAILAGGETVVYNLPKHSSTRIAKILKNWHVFS